MGDGGVDWVRGALAERERRGMEGCVYLCADLVVHPVREVLLGQALGVVVDVVEGVVHGLEGDVEEE